MESRTGTSPFVPLFIASLCIATSTILYNGALNETFSQVTDYARDWSTGVEIPVLLALAFIGRRRPGLIHPVAFTAAAVVSTVVGSMLAYFGWTGGSPTLVIAGTCLNTLSSAWCINLWFLALATLDGKRLCILLAACNLAGAPLALVVSLLPFALVLAVDLAFALLTVALIYPVARPYLERFVAIEDSRRLATEHPKAFVPLSSQVFVYIFAFSFAFGYGGRYEGSASVGMPFAVICPFMLAVIGITLAKGRKPSADGLAAVAFSVVLGGFLLVLMDDPRIAQASAALLQGGYSGFELLMNLMICSIVARTLADSVPAISWGIAVNYLGILIGAQAGILTESVLGADDRFFARLIIAAFIALATAYMILSARKFSLDATIDGIVPAPLEPEVRYVDLLAERCPAAAQRYGLTEREAEVMALLAHGNNARHIMEELCISHNTVKYHARNVYAKLGVHSQQELIDLLGGDAGNPGGAD